MLLSTYVERNVEHVSCESSIGSSKVSTNVVSTTTSNIFVCRTLSNVDHGGLSTNTELVTILSKDNGQLNTVMVNDDAINIDDADMDSEFPFIGIFKCFFILFDILEILLTSFI